MHRDFQNPLGATLRELPLRSDRYGGARSPSRTGNYQTFARAHACDRLRRAGRASTLQRRLRCRQPRDWNSERAATDVIQAEAVTEFYAHRFATVLAADSQFDIRPRFAAEVTSDFHQTSDAFLIDRCKRICIDDIELGVSWKKTAGIVPAHSERCLRKIVRAKAEELGVARDLVGQEHGARNFDHRSNKVFEFGSLFVRHFVGDASD